MKRRRIRANTWRNITKPGLACRAPHRLRVRALYQLLSGIRFVASFQVDLFRWSRPEPDPSRVTYE